MNSRQNASANVLARACDSMAQFLMSAACQPSDTMNAQMRANLRAEALKGFAALREVTLAPAAGVRCVRPYHVDFKANTAEEGFSTLREAAGVYSDDVEERPVEAAGAVVAFDYVSVRGKNAGRYVGRVYTSTPIMG